MVGSGPQHSGSVVQIAVALDVDGQAAMFFVGQSCAYRGWRLIADAGAALRSDIVVWLARDFLRSAIRASSLARIGFRFVAIMLRMAAGFPASSGGSGALSAAPDLQPGITSKLLIIKRKQKK